MATAPSQIVPLEKQDDLTAQPVMRRIRYRLGFRSVTTTLTTLGVVVVVAYLVLLPLFYLFEGTFVQDGRFTLDMLRAAYTTNGLGAMIGNSFEFAIGSTVLSILIGTLLAYLVARTDAPLKALVYVGALVPMIVPGVLYTIAWIFLASPQIGALNKLIEPVVGPGFFDVFSMKGMIFVEGVHQAPVAFLLMLAAFRNMDPSLEESALMSGGSRWKVFLKVTIPIVRPALILAALILMIRSLSSFEIPALLGVPNGNFVFTSRIFKALQNFPPNYGLAGAYSAGLLAVLAIFSVLQGRATKHSRSYQTITGKAFRPSLVKLGKFRGLAVVGVALYFIVGCVLPILVLMYASLRGFYSPPSRAALKDLSFDNYRALFSNHDFVGAFKNSLILAGGAATVIMLLAAVLAWVVYRQKPPGARLFNGLAMSPIGIPGIVIGVACLFLYLRVSLPIYGTLWILLIAYTTIFLPYGMTYASSAMYQISTELEESAQVSGGGFLNVFRKITLPLLMPGLAAGWIFIVLMSVRELGASLLLYTPGKQVLSIEIWQYWNNGDLTEVAALGVVMIAMLLVISAVARMLGAKVGVRAK
jgi:iron(III) transport system permease protein